MDSSDRSLKLESQRTFGVKLLHLLLSSIVIMLVIITFPYRQDVMDFKVLQQKVIATRLSVLHHRDPLRVRVSRSDIPTLLQIDKSKTFETNEARNFILNHILPTFEKPTDKDSKDFFVSANVSVLTPLQATMMLAGCYGNVYNDQNTPPNVKSTYQVLTEPLIWTMELTPFLLHALEMKNKIAETHDRSACSCMKDFSNPTIVSLRNDEKLMDKSFKDKLQDTCTMQNLIDYTMDGQGAILTGKNVEDLKKSTLVTSLVNANKVEEKRQRNDTLVQMLTEWKAKVTGTLDNHYLTFVSTYCALDQNCKSEWKTSPGTRAKSVFIDDLIAMVPTMMAHNKLRPPTICHGQSTCTTMPMDSNKRADLSFAGYNAYVEKYRDAFQMCARAGVPQYTTLKLGGMKTDFVYDIGQSFLFLAALFAFTWGYTIKRYIVETKKDFTKHFRMPASEKFKKEIDEECTWYYWNYTLGLICVGLSWIWLLLALIRGTQFFSVRYLEDDDTKNQLFHESDEAAAFFTIFFWIVFVVFFVLLIYLYTKWFEQVTIASRFLYGHAEKASKAVANSATGKALSAAARRAQQFMNPQTTKEQAMTTFATPYADIVTQITRASTSEAYDTHLDLFDREIVEYLGNMTPYAQVALDLTIICGLAAMAMATVAQRGVGDINVLSAVCVWFLAIGVIVHVSNMLRLTHVYMQFKNNTAHNEHVKGAAHTRVYTAVLLGAMIFFYVVFAGLDATSTQSSHTYNHQVLFALLALLILCGSDLLEHFAQAQKEVPVDAHDKATIERFWTTISMKNYYISWLLFASLFLLNLHRARGVCEAAIDLKWTGAQCFFKLKA